MMDSIVVTITDMNRTFMYDLQIPTKVNAKIVMAKIINAIFMINPGSGIRSTRRVIDERNGREINLNVTIEENCIWNGDYLVFI